MTYTLLIDEDALAYLEQLDEKSRRIITEKIKTLAEEPSPGKGSDKERLHTAGRYETYRLHISRTFTAFYQIEDSKQTVYINAIMTIEQAHKTYGRL